VEISGEISAAPSGETLAIATLAAPRMPQPWPPRIKRDACDEGGQGAAVAATLRSIAPGTHTCILSMTLNFFLSRFAVLVLKHREHEGLNFERFRFDASMFLVSLSLSRLHGGSFGFLDRISSVFQRNRYCRCFEVEIRKLFRRTMW
jgi:hypothetical protein